MTFKPPNTVANAHDAGGDAHIAASLALINAKISDATLIDPADTFVVSPANGHYTTIEAAITAAGLVAGVNRRVAVLVYPGNYTENNPLTLPEYVSLVCPGRHEATILTCANAGSSSTFSTPWSR
jgi:pectin methylesterase-like acyl-CoA thioesterase